ncbi:MAG: asparaginase, partial [Rhodospirillales bacterium]
MAAKDPFIVEVTRGDMVESRHRGAAVVMDASGGVVRAWGDADRVVFPRSAIKPLQAIPLIETGAAEAFGLGDDELALASASHGARPEHTDAVGRWLERIGLSADDLECGAHEPLDPESARAMVRAGRSPGPIHNNCSGKHAGFLAAARHLGEPTRGYVRPEHPAEKRWLAAVSEMAGAELTGAPRGTDGCGIPVVGLPLSAIARASARMADPGGLEPGRAEACRRIVAAMTGAPDMVAGQSRFDTVAIKAAAGALAVKTGAEGMYV